MQMWVRIVRDPQLNGAGKSMRDTLAAATMGSEVCPLKPKPEEKPGAVAPG
jgi:hypothetical protein